MSFSEVISGFQMTCCLIFPLFFFCCPLKLFHYSFLRRFHQGLVLKQLFENIPHHHHHHHPPLPPPTLPPHVYILYEITGLLFSKSTAFSDCTPLCVARLFALPERTLRQLLGFESGWGESCVQEDMAAICQMNSQRRTGNGSSLSRDGFDLTSPRSYMISSLTSNCSLAFNICAFHVDTSPPITSVLTLH